MKVGDYVKTKRGLIARILKINSTGSITCDRNVYWGAGNYNSKKVLCDLTQIIKSSPNIIDLIEVGDILSFEDGSICRIMEIDNDLKPPYYLLKDYGGDTYWERQEYLSDLKSIVTKEQFESMEYEVK